MFVVYVPGARPTRAGVTVTVLAVVESDNHATFSLAVHPVPVTVKGLRRLVAERQGRRGHAQHRGRCT